MECRLDTWLPADEEPQQRHHEVVFPKFNEIDELEWWESAPLWTDDRSVVSVLHARV